MNVDIGWFMSRFDREKEGERESPSVDYTHAHVHSSNPKSNHHPRHIRTLNTGPARLTAVMGCSVVMLWQVLIIWWAPPIPAWAATVPLGDGSRRPDPGFHPRPDILLKLFKYLERDWRAHKGHRGGREEGEDGNDAHLGCGTGVVGVCYCRWRMEEALLSGASIGFCWDRAGAI